ncbi:homeobox domain-containing protein [Endozoicomonas sp. Mp262]|uniref:homeobox domain-containing protein n=1 Tax=Endozoicomonas sp. Mp262 TaxID=2919499 RepID=UPI0021D879A3
MKELVLLTVIISCSNAIAVDISSYEQDYVIYIDDSRSYVVMPEDLNVFKIMSITHESTFVTIDGDTIVQFMAKTKQINTDYTENTVFQISYRTNIVSIGRQYTDPNVMTVDAESVSRTRKSRTRFTAQQLIILNNKFKENKFLTPDVRNAICTETGIVDPKVITVWFQNKRDKIKKQQKTMKPTSTVTNQEASFTSDSIGQ